MKATGELVKDSSLRAEYSANRFGNAIARAVMHVDPEPSGMRSLFPGARHQELLLKRAEQRHRGLLSAGRLQEPGCSGLAA
jgi:hypothetical protein